MQMTVPRVTTPGTKTKKNPCYTRVCFSLWNVHSTSNNFNNNNKARRKGGHEHRDLFILPIWCLRGAHVQRAGFGDAAVAAFLSLLSLSLAGQNHRNRAVYEQQTVRVNQKKKREAVRGVKLGFYGSTAIMAKGSVKRHNLKICRLLRRRELFVDCYLFCRTWRQIYGLNSTRVPLIRHVTDKQTSFFSLFAIQLASSGSSNRLGLNLNLMLR